MSILTDIKGAKGLDDAFEKLGVTKAELKKAEKEVPKLHYNAQRAIEELLSIINKDAKERKKKTGQQQADDLNEYWSQLDLLTDEEMRRAELEHLVTILETALHEAGMAPVLFSDIDAGEVTLRGAVNSKSPDLMQKAVKAIHDFAAAHRVRDNKLNRCVSIAKEIARRIGA